MSREIISKHKLEHVNYAEYKDALTALIIVLVRSVINPQTISRIKTTLANFAISKDVSIAKIMKPAVSVTKTKTTSYKIVYVSYVAQKDALIA